MTVRTLMCNTTYMTKQEQFIQAKNKGGIINLTPHAVTVAGATYEPSGIVARVDSSYTPIVDGLTSVEYGRVKFIQNGEEVKMDFEDVVHIVSAMVFEAVKNWESGVWVAPATGHPEVVRNEKGHIVSVPAFLI